MLKSFDSDPSIAIIKRFLSKAFIYKYYYLACFLLFIAIAFLYNKYSHRVYEVSASISPVQNETSSLLSSNELFRSIGTLQTDKNIENEINNLKSFAIVNSAISKMSLEVSYFIGKKGLLNESSELYRSVPYSVYIDKSHLQPLEAKFNITILNDSTFRLTASQKKAPLYNYVDNQIVSSNITLKVDTICHFNETVSSNYFKLSVSYHKELRIPKLTSKYYYYFTLHHPDFLSIYYLGQLDIKKVSPLSSIINIKFRGENEDKTISFLNQFLDTYLEENLAKKNKVAKSTINFIDSQISEMSDSLVKSESKLRNYRSANQVMDLSFQGQRTFDQMTQIETERAGLQVQERYYNYIINYFKTNNDVSGVAPPSSMNVSDPIMNQLITELLSLNSQRSSILSNSNEKNLFLGQIEQKIKIQKQAIIENVTNNLNTLSLSINELNYRSDKLSKEISQLPKTELNMVSMQRKFNLNSTIYTLLLQKRSEAEITLASNYPDYEILERARNVQTVQVAPKKMINLFIAIFLAFLIPSLYIIGLDLFNNKITNLHDIEQYLNRSAIGVIYSNERKTESVVLNYPGTSIAESFRNLRSNLFLKLKSEPAKIILVTSSIPGDGKSFDSFNLAASIATVGYKTDIIDCNLRRPTLHTKFNNDNSKGLSNYIVNGTPHPDISCKTPVENLFFIPTGPVIPNPSEQLELGVLDKLLIALRKDYEYIIMDTPPIGLVSDASLLIKYATQILLVVRNNYTHKDIFTNVVSSFSAKQIENYDIVFNDMSFENSPYKQYSSYYVKN
jgi:tyrosine-protein kinase Etk/Wzc